MYEIMLEQPRTFKIGPFTTSSKELVDLLKSWLAISVAFGIVIAGGLAGAFKLTFFKYFAIAAFTVGVGFLIHELAHKAVAQRYHCWAEFRSFDMMLGFAILMSLVGFVFAAPGAVMISGTVTRDRNGKISLAGPLANVLLAIGFLVAGFFVQSIVISYGFMINTWLAIFNMIPFGEFDGSKIFRWHKGVYVAMLVGAGALFALQFVGLR